MSRTVGIWLHGHRIQAKRGALDLGQLEAFTSAADLARRHLRQEAGFVSRCFGLGDCMGLGPGGVVPG